MHYRRVQKPGHPNPTSAVYQARYVLVSARLASSLIRDVDNGVVESNHRLGSARSSDAEIGAVPEEVLHAIVRHVNVPDWQVMAAPRWPNEVVDSMTYELMVEGAYSATKVG